MKYYTDYIQEKDLKNWGGYHGPECEVRVLEVDTDNASEDRYNYRKNVTYYKLDIQNPNTKNFETPDDCTALTKTELKKLGISIDII